MRGLAKSRRTDPWRAPRVVSPAKGNSPRRASGLASTSLMAAGSGLLIPRLDGAPVEQQLWQGEATAARLARTLIEANVADPGDWAAAKRNPFEFLKRALDRWLSTPARKYDDVF